MRFTIAQLEAFFWTAQLGSLSKASGHLHLAQPTISLRLRDLERTLGGGCGNRRVLPFAPRVRGYRTASPHARGGIRPAGERIPRWPP